MTTSRRRHFRLILKGKAGVGRQVGDRLALRPLSGGGKELTLVLNYDNGLGTTGLWDILEGCSWGLDCCKSLEENKRNLVTC